MHDSVMSIACRPPWVECLLPQEQTAGPGLLRHPPLLIGVLIVVVSQSFTLRKYYTLYLANLLFKCRLESHKAHVCMCNTLYSAGSQQRKVTPHNKNKEYSLWMEFIAQQYHFLVKAGPDTSIDESGMVAL